MGCGCNKGRRNTRSTITPVNIARNTPAKTREAAISQARDRAIGMTKEQRDLERKRRIQALLVKRNS
jgi:hypothetical protein